ncbi:TldD/PmbA family protein [Acidobacteria bacterium ACD]|nr:MAG: TldD/PmbA family protein [Acidobacteriota bacterium]MDL1951715.1 TldD/PmbA family protein [Acidobacteria bacterium ACD]
MDDLSGDAEDAVRLVRGMLRRGEGGEAFRERRRVLSWTVSEAGLLAPSLSEERGTAVRIRGERVALLVAREGDGPEAIRECVREASRRSGASPFFKAAHRAAAGAPAGPHGEEDERFATLLAGALSRALPDPRGLSLSLTVSRVQSARAVIGPRGAFPCGAAARVAASGILRRQERQRPFAFQSSRPLPAALDELATALAAAARPVPSVPPPTGEVDVVLSPSAASVFWHEVVGHALEAEATEGASALARVRGAAVAPRGVFVRDDPGRADLPGAYRFDDEGVPGRPVPLLVDGAVGELLTDRTTGGAASNGHGRTPDFRRFPRARLSNLVVSPGKVPLDELLSRCGTGLLVREVSSGGADPESGRFVLSVESAELIRRGRASTPVSPFVLAGEVLQALASVDPELGDTSAPGSGLSLCVKSGEPLPVGGASPAMIVRGLLARVPRR